MLADLWGVVVICLVVNHFSNMAVCHQWPRIFVFALHKLDQFLTDSKFVFLTIFSRELFVITHFIN